DEAKDVTSLLAIGADAKARIRILVVDDEHTLRESCATVLRHEGYDVTVCSRGQEALDLLKRRGFDIVLADLYMSQVDGLTLLRTALTTNHDTIVIVMTGNPSVEDRKSTRLNSSHVSISYAVFCLKKKKTRKRREQ